MGATPWATPGGDFVTTPLSSTVIPTNTLPGTLFSLNITPAVQDWITDPATNFGVLLKLANETAFDKCGLGFYSSNNTDPNGNPRNNPLLVINYETAIKDVDLQIIPPPKQYADAGGSIPYTARVTTNSVTSGSFDLTSTSLPPTWTITGLPPSVSVGAGQSVDVPFTVNVPANGVPGDTQTTRITATLSGVPEVSDSDEAQSLVRPDQPDLRLAVSVEPGYVLLPGELLTYTLVYTSFYQPVQNVVLTDTLPDDSIVEFVSASSGYTTRTVTTGVGSSIEVNWSGENLVELGVGSRQIVVRVRPGTPLYVRFLNVASVFGTPRDAANYQADNTVETFTATGERHYLPLVAVRPEFLPSR
jgi:hypothetical protein